jgi:DNA mismatch repair protein MutS
VIARAREVLRRHEQSERQLSEKLTPATSSNGAGEQQALFTTPLREEDREVLDALRAADLDQLRPIDALNLLAQLKKQIS